jgi:hypothetical protein
MLTYAKKNYYLDVLECKPAVRACLIQVAQRSALQTVVAVARMRTRVHVSDTFGMGRDSAPCCSILF